MEVVYGEMEETGSIVARVPEYLEDQKVVYVGKVVPISGSGTSESLGLRGRMMLK